MVMHLLVPTRGRPSSALRLDGALMDTCRGDTQVHYLVDADDLSAATYLGLLGSTVEINPLHPNRIVGLLNANAMDLLPSADTIGFMGDDHLPRTVGWDVELEKELAGRPGVAYGNDLLQGVFLPTAAVISKEVIETLGYLITPRLEHLYFDNFWKMIGGATHLRYRNDVIVEHLHYTNGKSANDETYQNGNSDAIWTKDGEAWRQYLDEDWPADYEKLKGLR